MTEHLLSINLLIALAGLLFIALTRSDKKAMIRTTAVIVGGLQLWIAFEILFGFDPLETALQFTERIRWIAALRIEYYIGIDSTNLIFIVLTALIFFLSVLISGKDDPRTKEYFLILLMIDLGLTGTFAAMNLFLFFIFLGLTGFGVYLMIGMWSGSSESNAVNRFGLFFILGYIFILLGLILIYHNNNLHTLNFSELAAGAVLSSEMQLVIALIFLIGLALIIPLIPFHGWLIPVIKKAPVGINMLIGGVLTKIGIYGFIRIIIQVLPSAVHSMALGIGIWGLLNIIYAAICALGSTDTDEFLGYFTLQQTGFILIGLATITEAANLGIFQENTQDFLAVVSGLSGSLMLACSHAISFTLLLIILKKTVHDGINFHPVPPGWRLFAIMTLLSAAGMPGFMDFIARFMTILGAYQIPELKAVAIISLLGLFANTIVILRLFGRLIFNNPPGADQMETGFSFDEKFIVVTLLVFLVLAGLFPGFFLNTVQDGLVRMVRTFSQMVAA